MTLLASLHQPQRTIVEEYKALRGREATGDRGAQLRVSCHSLTHLSQFEQTFGGERPECELLHHGTDSTLTEDTRLSSQNALSLSLSLSHTHRHRHTHLHTHILAQ